MNIITYTQEHLASLTDKQRQSIKHSLKREREKLDRGIYNKHVMNRIAGIDDALELLRGNTLMQNARFFLVGLVTNAKFFVQSTILGLTLFIIFAFVGVLILTGLSQMF